MVEVYLSQTWKDNNIVGFWTFCDILFNQMMNYNSTHRKYEGESRMRPAKQKIQSTKSKSKDSARVKIGRPLSEEFQFSNLSKKSKKPSISEVPFHVCVGISYSQT